MGNHHHIESRVDPQGPEPLPHEPLRSIPRDRPSDFSRRHDAETRRALVTPGMNDHHGHAASSRRALILDANECVASQEPLRLGKVRGFAGYFFQVDTVSRLRPLRRRLARTFWPPLVLMRLR